MFTLSRDDKLLSFTLERESFSFGEGTRVLFWIDLEQRALQRGRQEAIPVDTIDGFGVDSEGAEEARLFCRIGSSDITLHRDKDEDGLRKAAAELAEFCGVETV